jgi:hypothetical protein
MADDFNGTIRNQPIPPCIGGEGETLIKNNHNYRVTDLSHFSDSRDTKTLAFFGNKK